MSDLADRYFESVRSWLAGLGGGFSVYALNEEGYSAIVYLFVVLIGLLVFEKVGQRRNIGN
ncbi:hypothetical protein [Candidatus Nanohalobium constans]|uniref:Uncharacterized protein n=1 Tax=Candidatus Nanohalobium constans TaxID=2565781 RepID=A0A5Q0UG40_9ARCH|nr:hypothetical protein [Candidatus Nanohalobium constans]QGA80567.1 hypothetical protein LC1Nh_0676 [Candidatus Nanohalobium constans]